MGTCGSTLSMLEEGEMEVGSRDGMSALARGPKSLWRRDGRSRGVEFSLAENAFLRALTATYSDSHTPEAHAIAAYRWGIRSMLWWAQGAVVGADLEPFASGPLPTPPVDAEVRMDIVMECYRRLRPLLGDVREEEFETEVLLMCDVLPTLPLAVGVNIRVGILDLVDCIPETDRWRRRLPLWEVPHKREARLERIGVELVHQRAMIRALTAGEVNVVFHRIPVLTGTAREVDEESGRPNLATWTTTGVSEAIAGAAPSIDLFLVLYDGAGDGSAGEVSCMQPELGLDVATLHHARGWTWASTGELCSLRPQHAFVRSFFSFAEETLGFGPHLTSWKPSATPHLPPKWTQLGMLRYIGARLAYELERCPSRDAPMRMHERTFPIPSRNAFIARLALVDGSGEEGLSGPIIDAAYAQSLCSASYRLGEAFSYLANHIYSLAHSCPPGPWDITPPPISSIHFPSAFDGAAPIRPGEHGWGIKARDWSSAKKTEESADSWSYNEATSDVMQAGARLVKCLYGLKAEEWPSSHERDTIGHTILEAVKILIKKRHIGPALGLALFVANVITRDRAEPWVVAVDALLSWADGCESEVQRQQWANMGMQCAKVGIELEPADSSNALALLRAYSRSHAPSADTARRLALRAVLGARNRASPTAERVMAAVGRPLAVVAQTFSASHSSTDADHGESEEGKGEGGGGSGVESGEVDEDSTFGLAVSFAPNDGTLWWRWALAKESRGKKVLWEAYARHAASLGSSEARRALRKAKIKHREESPIPTHPSVAPILTALHQQEDGKGLKVAVMVASSESYAYFSVGAALGHMEHCHVQFGVGSQIIPLLTRSNVLLIIDHSPQALWESLGKDQRERAVARAELRRFVASGGGCVGVSGGATFATSSSYLGLVRAGILNRSTWFPPEEDILLHFSSRGREVLSNKVDPLCTTEEPSRVAAIRFAEIALDATTTLTGSIRCFFDGGPILRPLPSLPPTPPDPMMPPISGDFRVAAAHGFELVKRIDRRILPEAEAPVTPLAAFLSDAYRGGMPQGVMKGAAAALETTFGEGRVVVMGFRPDLTPGLGRVLAQAVKHCMNEM